MQLMPALPYAHQTDRNLVMALYAMHLAQGYGIQCRTLKSGTIQRYLLAAATISENHKLPDPRLNNRGITSSYIHKVLNELKRWEDMPNRREPVTVAMLRKMHALCDTMHDDSLESALYDWNVLGIYYGFRLGEWAQNVSTKPMPLRSTDGSPIAFTFNDITFYGPNRTRLNQTWETTLDPTAVAEVQLRWTVQKNLNNGETISQAKNTNIRLCAVLAALRVRARAQRVNANEHAVMAVFSNRNKTTHITNKHITSHLQAMATAAHGVTSKEELKRWTPHSIRVGACVSLSEGGKDGHFIKLRLRWKSDTYLLYLRNTSHLAAQHSTTITHNQQY